jgi:hypothetical protein
MLMQHHSGIASPAPRRRGRPGLAVVEFAVIAPVLLFLIVSMLEMATAVQIKAVLTDAARKGCRTGILPDGTNSAVTTDISSVLTNAGITPGLATNTIKVNGASVNVSTAAANTPISVKVSLPFSSVATVTGFFLTGKNIESETIVMMSQR